MSQNERLIEDARKILPDDHETGKLIKVPVTKGPAYFPDEELASHVSQICFVHFRKTENGWDFVEVTEE